MKKLLFLVFAVCTILTARPQVHFGIKAGYNLTSILISGDNAISNVKSKPNFNAGIFSTIHLFESFVLQAEIIYSGQGAGTKDSSSTANYNYLNVPILFKYRHSSGLFIETGPQVGFRLSAKFTMDGTTTDEKNAIKSSDFAWVFGAGYKIPIANFGIDLRYNLGLSNIQNYNIATVKNSVLQIDLFYIFK